MADNKTPKFYFNDKDARRYGARFLTIGEQVKVKAEIDRVTNGMFSTWKVSADEEDRAAAAMTEFAVTLNKVLVSWPEGVTPVTDFLDSEDVEQLAQLWEAYSAAATDFRQRGRQPQSGSAVLVEGPSA